MTYIAQESPATELSFDARYEYRMRRGLAVEGTALTAFSESVEEEGTTIPVLLASPTSGRYTRMPKPQG